MPDRRKHRGPHPRDHQLFAAAVLPRLRAAVDDLAWLLNRDYPSHAALKLVGDRYELIQRQRVAVLRATCSDKARDRRRAHQIEPRALQNEKLHIDGFNLLTTVEAALAGGVVLQCRDGCFRDMASVYGTWRRVTETEPALTSIGRLLAGLSPKRVLWYLDRPVSNSGRLKLQIQEIAERHDWPWVVELVANPDRLLREAVSVIASADSVVIDGTARWLNLARVAVTQIAPSAWILDLEQ